MVDFAEYKNGKTKLTSQVVRFNSRFNLHFISLSCVELCPKFSLLSISQDQYAGLVNNQHCTFALPTPSPRLVVKYQV
jgi:hypothetical protein